MQPLKNHLGNVVEKYIPRKCSATSRLIGPKDHAAIQLLIPEVDENGRVNIYKGFKLAMSGFIRDKGRSDYEIEKLLWSKDLYPCK